MDLSFFEEKTWVEKLRLLFWALIIIGVGLVLVILVRGESLVIRDPGAYQAVFLDNNQVYFGRLESLNRDFLSLRDVYYLRTGTVQTAQDQPAGTQVDLIKLGAELHSPKDEMIINKSHVLYYEDLGENGEVMKLIRKHKLGK